MLKIKRPTYISIKIGDEAEINETSIRKIAVNRSQLILIQNEKKSRVIRQYILTKISKI